MGKESRGVAVVIPFYRTPELVAPLFESIYRLRHELAELDCTIVIINDSPGDEVLRHELARETGRLRGTLNCLLLENECNEGFVRSANRGLRKTLVLGLDALLLNSDTVLFPGAVPELRRVAYLSPSTGFVSPRSNNASVCSLPHQPKYASLPPEASFSLYRRLARFLPDHHIVPTGVGFCLYIKLTVLRELGVLDEIYSPGYQEENDLIMRGRACGYDVALANHAYVYHVGSASFSISPASKKVLDQPHLITLSERYPEFVNLAVQYCQGAHVEAETLLPGLLPDSAGRLDLVLDLTAIAADHDGASQTIRGIATRAIPLWNPWFRITVIGARNSLDSCRLQELCCASSDELPGSRIFAVAVRLGLPSNPDQVVRFSRMSPCNVYVALDGDSPDSLAPQADELGEFVAQHADGVVYETASTRDRFRAKYPCRPSLKECVITLAGKGVGHEATPDPDPARDDSRWLQTAEATCAFLKEIVRCVSFELVLKRRLRAARALGRRFPQ